MLVGVAVSLPLLLAGLVDGVLNDSSGLLVPIVLVLPIAGGILLIRSIDRPPRPVPVGPDPDGRVAPVGMPVTHVGTIEPLPFGTRLGGYVLERSHRHLHARDRLAHLVDGRLGPRLVAW